jgi:CRISPR type III-A-associated RAMP protein Csm4
MMSFTTYYFHFPGGLHLGDARPDDYGKSEDYLYSDVLHAALIATQAKMGVVLPGPEGPAYQLSSCFPFATDTVGEKVHFFPKLMQAFNLGEGQIDYAKKLKRARWLDADYFSQQLHHQFTDFGGKDQPHFQGGYLTGAKLALAKDHKIVFHATAQRVTAPRGLREGEDATPFIFDKCFFADGAGLYCLFQGDANAKQGFEAALNLLQYEGLGTDRNVGNGQFSWSAGTLDLKVPASATHRTNLSLFCPETPEQLSGMIDERTAYAFVRRGGWITTDAGLGKRKRSVTMFREGSVFKTDQTIAGRAAIDLAPRNSAGESTLGHPVWRNGQAIFLPIKFT